MTFWDSAILAMVFAIAGGPVWIVGDGFGWEHKGVAALSVASLGLVAIARAWWIGPLCDRMDRIAALLEREEGQPGGASATAQEGPEPPADAPKA